MIAYRPQNRTVYRAVLGTVLLLLVSLLGLSAPAAWGGAPKGTAKPTVVLVHGAFADASSFNGVTTRLQRRGFTVVAPAIPLRGIAADSAYLASVLDQVKGPVVLVGHSYGGALMSNAATGARNVRALVFVSGFATAEGEVLSEVESRSKDSVLGPALRRFQYPTTGSATATELIVDPALFPAVFAADLPAKEAAVLAATQRATSEFAFSEPAGPPAWKRLPSWAVVASGDKAAGADVVRSMAERAGARITELKGSHMIMTSQPGAVTGVILDAVEATD
jgi:pimeloyl-ACP methyl ester carboxylesterase